LLFGFDVNSFVARGGWMMHSFGSFREENEHHGLWWSQIVAD